MCAGFGKYVLGAGATILLLITLRGVAFLEQRREKMKAPAVP
jgi:hypothetical protein